MTVITLTGHLGSMGTIATRVAAGLGYALADRELLLEAAEALGWTEAEVAAFDERTGGQGGRLARFLRDFAANVPVDDIGGSGLGTLAGSSYRDAAMVAEMRPQDQRYIEVLSALIRGLAEHGDAVIVGRGGQALLAGRSDTVHVRIICEREERVRRIAERDGMTEQDARARVEDSDRQREAWHQKYFRVDYESPYLYHAVMNSGRLPDDVVANAVMQLAEAATQRAARGETLGAERREPAGARQDWGWIELVDHATGSVDARAHLFATEIELESGWGGQLESIHLSPGVSSLKPGLYFARFALSGTDHVVRLEMAEQGAQVRSDDAEVPAIFRERSEG
jgi:cytidylate kinase